MKQRSVKFKTMVVLLVLALLGGQAAMAQDAAGSASATLRMKFADVPTTHWAIKHITKLALQGIIQGVDEANFNPEGKVSQQDAVIMAIRAMGLESEALGRSSGYVLPFDVSDYAKPYVATALDKGLLNIQEETSGNTAAGPWGSRDATREWVAKIVIRAIGKQDEALRLASTATSFTDNGQISDWALGFINAAVQLGIVNGFEDGTFRPQGEVTRAQMATFLNRADMTRRTKGVTIGYVTRFTDNKLSVVDEDGRNFEFGLSDNVVFYTVKDDSARIPSTFIQPNMKVYVIADQGTAYYVEDLNELRQEAETVAGSLYELNVDQLTLSLVTVNGNESFKISPMVTVVNPDGKGSSLGALVTGSQLELRKRGDVVEHITVKAVPVNKNGEAVITTVDRDKALLTWSDVSTGRAETFVYSGQISVRYNDNVIGIDQINPGDAVQYQVQNNVVTSLVVTKPVVEPKGTFNQGVLKSIDLNNKFITIATADGSLASYYVADNTQVVIEGAESAALTDLVPGDNVKIELSNLTARKITVLNRSVKAKLLSTIVYYDSETRYLGVQDAEGKPAAYTLTPASNIIYEGMTVSLNDFERYFLKGKKVDITASSNNTIVTIRLATRYEGTLMNINSAASELSLKMADGNLITFKLASYTGVDIPGQSNATVAALRPGDAVRVILNPTQDQVINIAVRKSILYRVVAKDAANRQLTLMDPLGATVTYNIASDVSVTSPVSMQLTLNDVPLNEPVSISFFGSTMEKITLLYPIRGKVAAIDANGGKLTVVDYNNVSRVVDLGQQPTFVQNSRLLAGIGAVKVGDRVEVTTGPDGKVYVQVAVAARKSVMTYDTYSQQLILRRTAQDEKTNYTFFADAYIHKGTEIVSPTSLYNLDAMIYTVDGIIMELETLT
jgi:hypothetical protein